MTWPPSRNNSDHGSRMENIRAIACRIACGLIGTVFFEQSIAQQVTAKYDVSGQIDSEKVPAWMQEPLD